MDLGLEREVCNTMGTRMCWICIKKKDHYLSIR